MGGKAFKMTLAEYEELWIDYPNYKIRHNSDLLPLFINKAMMYPKGEKFQYNNSGYVLLAMIIEKITGMYFDQYLKKKVFDVCGMHATGYYALDKQPSKCANNYIYCADTKDYRTNIFSVDAKGTGAGGAFVTVRDMINFWTNLAAGNLISEAQDLQARDFVANHANANIASGWVIKKCGFLFDHYGQYSRFDGSETFDASFYVLHVGESHEF